MRPPITSPRRAAAHAIDSLRRAREELRALSDLDARDLDEEGRAAELWRGADNGGAT